jgi:hypothetical protein
MAPGAVEQGAQLAHRVSLDLDDVVAPAGAPLRQREPRRREVDATGEAMHTVDDEDLPVVACLHARQPEARVQR